MQLDEITAVIEVDLSFVVSVPVGPGSALTGDKPKDALLAQVQAHLDAACRLKSCAITHSPNGLKRSIFVSTKLRQL
jgi:hypothetical protein